MHVIVNNEHPLSFPINNEHQLSFPINNEHQLSFPSPSVGGVGEGQLPTTQNAEIIAFRA